MFFDTFQKLCAEKGVSVSAAAAEIGLSNSTPTKWRKTKAKPDGNTLSKIADYFAVSTDYLLGIGLPLEDEHRKYAFGQSQERVIRSIFDIARKESLTLGQLEAVLGQAQKDVSRMMRESAIPQNVHN